MKIVDRHILKEMVKFAFLALLSVVVIYLLIDLFEELNYFTTRKVSFFNILLYYVYSLPSAVVLLYPVSLLLAVFLVYGQLTRYLELHALESAGISAVRLFVPAIALGLVTVFVYLVGNEFVAIPCNARLSDLRKYTIEKRAVPEAQKRGDVHFVGEGGRVFFIKEFKSSGVMHNFSVEELGPNRKLRRRIDGREAFYQDSSWVGHDVTVRVFGIDGIEKLVRYDTLVMKDITETPTDFVQSPRPVCETSTLALRQSIERMRRAGKDVAKEEVEYHYRFSYSLVGFLVVLLGLPLSIQLRRGGVMFGLGLGLLVSFLYWGAIQTSRAYGTSHMISPALAAWLPDIVFGAVAVILIFNVRQ
ncbi:hypothetical protein CH330_07365 [candidate division WOR-3 bacterium JGI_Cruoil_03_51_56]|uniref:YjgP/YjgQ family permease n=1 Tax=candidate division WOR-3 bacterium JGI_Cruoil_03_51_56 TaxID=1973747 RepID=A0A235BRK2_UNCW3|nr:MAG: hypothetical protein CH330_07365 [candidate division WOR-3 bacterium JGI_Cruoil_03_51_56]